MYVYVRLMDHHHTAVSCLCHLSLVDAYSYVVMLFLLAPEHGSRHHALVTYIEDADHVNVDIVP